MRKITIIIFVALYSINGIAQSKAPKNNKDVDQLAKYLLEIIKENDPSKLSFFEYSEKEGIYLNNTCESSENQFSRSCEKLKRNIGTERNMFIKTFIHVIGAAHFLEDSEVQAMEITEIKKSRVLPGDFQIHKLTILFQIGKQKGEITISDAVKSKKGWYFVGDAGFTLFQ